MIVVKDKPVSGTLPRFVPVIFANGEDDDWPGLQAFVDDEAVLFDDRIYEPEDSLTIRRRHIVLSRMLVCDVISCAPIDETPPAGRYLLLDRCRIELRGGGCDVS